MSAGKPAILAAIDCYGADLAAWPDGELAAAARTAAMRDSEVRAALDDARGLATGLDRACADIDEEIARSGAAARLGASVLAAVRPDPNRRLRWAAIAAALVLAGALGGVVGLMRSEPANLGRVDIVVLDPLVFGPTEVDRP